jgi:hypothetical protein
MTPLPRIDWPAQTPPDDFADRVVDAALADRTAAAQDERAALGVGDLPMRTSLQPRKRGWRGRITWFLAAACLLSFAGWVFVLGRTREAERQAAEQAAIIATKEEETRRLQQDMIQAQAKIDALMDQLATASTDANRTELKRKIEEEKSRQLAAKSMTTVAAGGGGPRALAAAAPAAEVPMSVAAKKPAAAASAGRPPAAAAKKACTCQPGDPFCSCR